MFEVSYDTKVQGISTWIAKTVHDAGFTKVIVAVSGGVDSATSLFLAVKALGAEHVYAVLLPYGKMSSTALRHGKLATKVAGLAKDHIFVRDIKSAVDVISSISNLNVNEVERSQAEISPRASLGRNDNVDNIRKGNMMARTRMIYLFDLAKELGALVVGTENKSEHYLGYFTRFGDEASDIEPIRSLYKTHVWEMAKYLGVPQEIIDKKPSANLWEDQSDEGEFGFSYLEADKILYYHFEAKLPVDGIVALGFDKKVVEQVLSFVAKNDFKHKVPYVFE